MFYISIDKLTSIKVNKERYYDSDCFVARIITKDPHLLKTCFAHDDYRYVAPMSEVYEEHNAIFMVNADWSSIDFHENYLIRNNIVIREGVHGGAYGAYFCILDDGHLAFMDLYSRVEDAIEAGVVHSFSFWSDNLLPNGEPKGDDYARHPRTFIGEVPRDDGYLEYIIIVADGRRPDSAGLTNYQEALILKEKGCNIGYNLDGGGSSEMIFDGRILNIPSDGQERYDHDFIYIEKP